MGYILGVLLILGLIGFVIKSPVKAIMWITTIGGVGWFFFSYTKYFFYSLLILFALGVVNSALNKARQKKRFLMMLANGNYEGIACDYSVLKEKKKMKALRLIEDISQRHELDLNYVLNSVFVKLVKKEVLERLAVDSVVDSDSIESGMKTDAKIFSKIVPLLGFREALISVAEESGFEINCIKTERGKDVTLVNKKNAGAIQRMEICLDDC